ncbi:hypothetical protein ACIRFH_34510 [Streptomyces sp. NPDC093586]
MTPVADFVLQCPTERGARRTRGCAQGVRRTAVEPVQHLPGRHP